MAKRKTNKSEAIRQQLAKYPDKPAKDIAKHLKVQPSLVYQVKASLKKKTAKRRKRTSAGELAGVAITQVIDAANLIKSCGSLEQAREALKAAEKVAKALG